VPPKRPADLLVGRGVFNRLCYTCHTIFGSGANFGPDLTDRGLTPDGRPKRTDLNFLLTSIIDPSAELAKEYEPSVVPDERTDLFRHHQGAIRRDCHANDADESPGLSQKRHRGNRSQQGLVDAG